MQTLLRDRDYIRDRSHNFLKVVGDYHPPDNVVSYVKYFPSEQGSREIRGFPAMRFGYNTFVPKSFSILPHHPERTCYSAFHGGVVPCTPCKDIVRTFSCQQKLQEIWSKRETYRNHPVGSDLIAFLEAIADHVDLTQVGITGSFLLDAYTPTSDIDLVCYGPQAYEQMCWAFHQSNVLIPYTDQVYARRLYTRRMIHMAPMNFQLLITQEARKLQGVTRDHQVHINCQPLRDLVSQSYGDLTFMEVGEISCIVEIIEDREGVYAPAIYSIRVSDVLDSLFLHDQIRQDLRTLVSFGGTYSSTFRCGDKVFVQGKIVQIRRGNQGSLSYGVEVTPWNTSRVFQANLLHSPTMVTIFPRP